MSATIGFSMLMCLSSVQSAGDEHGRLQGVDFPQVRIDDGFWSPRLRANRTKTLAANLHQCEITGRLDNFAKAGKLMEGKFKGIYFNDSDVYKVLEGASAMLAADRDPELEKRVDRIISWIAAAQQPDGYLNTYYTLVEPDKRWTNLPVRHELYCAGHLFEAAVAHYLATGKKTLLNVATKFADHIDARFGEGKQIGVPGHEEIELALLKLYRVTGEKRYRALASFFLETRGQERNEKNMALQAHLPIREQRDIVGHAVRAMYLYSGVADMTRLNGDKGFLATMDRIWNNVVHKKMYITGGIGSSSHNEGFTADYDLPNDSAYAETCASIGMALWNHRMNLLHGDAKYADVLERALYNGILSGVSLDGSKFFYVNPLASQGTHHRQAWFSTACCPSNIVRYLPALGGTVYATSAEGIWVNLYLSNRARIKMGKEEVVVRQETRYPWSGRVQLHVEPPTPTRFAMHLRIPGWCRSWSYTVNGKAVESVEPVSGYIAIGRQWRPGDVIELNLAMPIERIEARPEVEANTGRVALQRGPIVYCLEDVDHEVGVRSIALPRNAELKAEFRSDLLGGVTVITGVGLAQEEEAQWGDALYRRVEPANKVRLTAVPYCTWDNRQPGAMVVWIPENLRDAEPPRKLTLAGRAKPSASHVCSSDTVTALNDGLEPKNSDDHSIPRFTWWDHQGGTEWVGLTFAKPTRVSKAEVYWFDDGPSGGGCRVPASWRLLWKDGPAWKPVSSVKESPVMRDEFCTLVFDTVETAALRIEVRLQKGYSGGILEWRVDE